MVACFSWDCKGPCGKSRLRNRRPIVSGSFPGQRRRRWYSGDCRGPGKSLTLEAAAATVLSGNRYGNIAHFCQVYSGSVEWRILTQMKGDSSS